MAAALTEIFFYFDSALATGLAKEKAMEIHISISWRSTQYCGILCAKALVWKRHAQSKGGCISGVALQEAVTRRKCPMEVEVKTASTKYTTVSGEIHFVHLTYCDWA